jgi:hypothetical protein
MLGREIFENVKDNHRYIRKLIKGKEVVEVDDEEIWDFKLTNYGIEWKWKNKRGGDRLTFKDDIEVVDYGPKGMAISTSDDEEYHFTIE